VKVLGGRLCLGEDVPATWRIQSRWLANFPLVSDGIQPRSDPTRGEMTATINQTLNEGCRSPPSDRIQTRRAAEVVDIRL
jgi:hypothetical protein